MRRSAKRGAPQSLARRQPIPRPRGGSASRKGAPGAANAAFVWTLAFVALHVYWYLGGRVGFGDQADPLPSAPSSLGDWIFTVVVAAMFAVGLVVRNALARTWGRRLPRRLLVWSMWTGGATLVARGGLGLLDDALRFSGLLDGGLTGLSTKDVLGDAQPSTNTVVSTMGVDSTFLIGGLLFGYAARVSGAAPQNRQTGSAHLR